jgi:hypothetical protein
MRLLSIFLACILAIMALTACPKQANDHGVTFDPGPPPTREEIVKYISNESGVQDFLNIYWWNKPNKAFASSPDGVYGYSGELMTTPDYAAESALRYCESIRERLKVISPCKLVNMNGEWLP